MPFSIFLLLSCPEKNWLFLVFGILTGSLTFPFSLKSCTHSFSCLVWHIPLWQVSKKLTCIFLNAHGKIIQPTAEITPYVSLCMYQKGKKNQTKTFTNKFSFEELISVLISELILGVFFLLCWKNGALRPLDSFQMEFIFRNVAILLWNMYMPKLSLLLSKLFKHHRCFLLLIWRLKSSGNWKN